MKIGIITIHYVANYGALLQAYATKKLFERNCEDVSIIDYRTIEKEQFYNVYSLLKYEIGKGIVFILNIPRKLFLNRYFIIARRKLNLFINEMIRREDYVVKADLKEKSKKYDAIIVGSDQVWNPSIISLDSSFLLDFFDKKKYSFASSFGVADLNAECEEVYKRNLNKFSLLSVRESEGKKIIERMGLEKKVNVVLDPTLMLSKEEWDTYFDISTEKIKEPYIFVYTVKEDKEILKYAKSMKEKTGLNTIFVSTPGVLSVQKELRKNKCRCDISPKEWLGLIKNAKYILTNSFHGIAFSINYEKQFFISHQVDDKYSKDLSRINNIMNIFGLQDRVVLNDQIDVEMKIDYKKLNLVLNDKRVETQRYIDEIINDIKE